jgi:hypothetical protein
MPWALPAELRLKVDIAVSTSAAMIGYESAQARGASGPVPS